MWTLYIDAGLYLLLQSHHVVLFGLRKSLLSKIAAVLNSCFARIQDIVCVWIIQDTFQHVNVVELNQLDAVCVDWDYASALNLRRTRIDAGVVVNTWNVIEVTRSWDVPLTINVYVFLDKEIVLPSHFNSKFEVQFKRFVSCPDAVCLRILTIRVDLAYVISIV